MSAGAAAASSAAGAAAASGAGRDDPRLKKRRLVGRSKAKKPADRSKENNAQRFAHNMGEKRCTGHADGERCGCRTSLQPDDKVEYIAVSGQYFRHPHCLFNQFMCNHDGRWGEHFDMSLFPTGDRKFYKAIQSSDVWGNKSKGSRHYRRVQRPGEEIRDPSEATDGKATRPTDDRATHFMDARLYRPEGVAGGTPIERRLLEDFWGERESMDLLVNKTPEGVAAMLAAWGRFLADWLPRTETKKKEKEKEQETAGRKRAAGGSANPPPPRRRKKAAGSGAAKGPAPAANAAADEPGSSQSGLTAPDAGAGAGAGDAADSMSASAAAAAAAPPRAPNEQPALDELNEPDAAAAMASLHPAKLDLAILKMDSEPQAREVFDKAVQAVLTFAAVDATFRKVAGGASRGTPAQYFAARVVSAADTCRRIRNFQQSAQPTATASPVASPLASPTAAAAAAATPGPAAAAAAAASPPPPVGQASAAGGASSAAATASALSGEESGALNELWEVVAKLKPEHRHLMEQVTRKSLRRLTGKRTSGRRTTEKMVGSVASFLQSPAFTDDEGGRAEAAGMFDEMTFSQ